MTREEAKELLPIIQAWSEGKQIQYRNHEGNWEDLRKDFCPIGYNDVRIKPEPKYRPFKNREECWNEMQKHQPFGWLSHRSKYFQILEIAIGGIRIAESFCTFGEAADFIFSDGTPFGIEV